LRSLAPLQFCRSFSLLHFTPLHQCKREAVFRLELLFRLIQNSRVMIGEMVALSLTQVSEIVKILGLVSGGLWAAWTFQKLQKVRDADSKVKRELIDQQEIRARLLRQQPQLAIKLNVSEETSPTEAYKSLLCVTATLKNEGEQNLKVIFDQSALTIARLACDEDGTRNIESVSVRSIVFLR